MAKFINVDMSSQSFANAIQELTKYQKEAEEKANNLIKRLAEIGAEAVRNKFAETDHIGDDGIPFVVIERTNNGWAIVAKGNEVAFVEFGTGIMASYPEAVNGVIVSDGSFSRTQGTGEYAKYGSWHHKGIKYKDNPPAYSKPALGFVEARAAILRELPRVAKEIFG